VRNFVTCSATLDEYRAVIAACCYEALDSQPDTKMPELDGSYILEQNEEQEK